MSNRNTYTIHHYVKSIMAVEVAKVMRDLTNVPIFHGTLDRKSEEVGRFYVYADMQDFANDSSDRRRLWDCCQEAMQRVLRAELKGVSKWVNDNHSDKVRLNNVLESIRHLQPGFKADRDYYQLETRQQAKARRDVVSTHNQRAWDLEEDHKVIKAQTK